jgi:hypothetical protein
MRYFIQATEYTIIMLEKIQYSNMHGFFVNNFLKTGFLGILYNAIKHKKGFDQPKCIYLLKRILNKFTSSFSEFYSIFYLFYNFNEFPCVLN